MICGVPGEPHLAIGILPDLPFAITTSYARPTMNPIKMKKPPTSRRTSVAVVIVPILNCAAWNVPAYDEGEVEAELIC